MAATTKLYNSAAILSVVFFPTMNFSAGLIIVIEKIYNSGTKVNGQYVCNPCGMTLIPNNKLAPRHKPIFKGPKNLFCFDHLSYTTAATAINIAIDVASGKNGFLIGKSSSNNSY